VAVTKAPTAFHIAAATVSAPPPSAVVNSPGALRIPAIALSAYRNAERMMASAYPGCGVSWNLLAGIGRIESLHANGGATDSFWTGLGGVRRGAFEAVGGFDSDRYRHPSIEDIDLGRRLTEAGATIRLDPAIQGTHLKRWTLRSLVWTDFASRGVPWVALMWRTRTLPDTLNLGLVHRCSALASVGTVLAVVLGSLAIAAACVAALVALNHSFYALLVRQLGLVRTVAGVGLHALHHLVAVVAVPVGVAAALLASSTTRQATRRTGALGVESAVE